MHHSGLTHSEKTTTARDTIRRSLDQLENLKTLGLDLSTIPLYRRGVEAEADCEKALKQPKAYLDGKPDLEEKFLEDKKRQGIP